MGIQEEYRKKICEIFNEKALRLQKPIAYNTRSLWVLRESVEVEKKMICNQYKASKVIGLLLKHPNISGRKVAQKVEFC